MLLCDIGNSSYHFYDGLSDSKEDVTLFDPSCVKERVYYICVNLHVKKILGSLENWIDLEIYVDRAKYYSTMGIDRIAACEAIKDGVVVDAGSAVTVDIVKEGSHMGGFIYPGVNAMQRTYKNISLALDYSFNFELDFGKMPKNSQDAVSYGYLKLIYGEVSSYGMDIYLTGGDASLFAKIFPSAHVDELLLFSGMKNIIKKADLC